METTGTDIAVVVAVGKECYLTISLKQMSRVCARRNLVRKLVDPHFTAVYAECGCATLLNVSRYFKPHYCRPRVSLHWSALAGPWSSEKIAVQLCEETRTGRLETLSCWSSRMSASRLGRPSKHEIPMQRRHPSEAED